MRGWLAILTVSLASAGTVFAQPRVSPLANPLLAAGRSLSPTTNEPLPEGTAVSQPLQPVEEPEPPATPTPPDDPAPTSPNELMAEILPPLRGLSACWDSDAFLLWWPKSQPVPPLLAATRFAVPGSNQGGTRLLIGGRPIDPQDQAGGRFVIGRSVNESNTVGLEGIYFFLGTRTQTATVRGIDNPRIESIGFPIFDPVDRTHALLTLSQRGVNASQVDVSTSTRMQGAEMNVVANLIECPNVRFNGLMGYRYLQLQEGLRNEAFIVQNAGVNGLPTSIAQTADQFDTANRFSGGQIGLSLDASHSVLFFEVTGKLGIGSNFEVVKVQGQTNTLIGYQPLGQPGSYPSGVYAEPTNIGRFTRSVFALAPEAMVKVGLKLHDRSRFFAAYNFLYLSDAVRPGDQVDLAVNPNQIRLLNPNGTPTGPDRPAPLFNRTDFWVQGLVLGFEGRY